MEHRSFDWRCGSCCFFKSSNDKRRKHGWGYCTFNFPPYLKVGIGQVFEHDACDLFRPKVNQPQGEIL